MTSLAFRTLSSASGVSWKETKQQTSTCLSPLCLSTLRSVGDFSHLYFEQALTQLDQISCGETVAIQGNVLVAESDMRKQLEERANCFLKLDSLNEGNTPTSLGS